MKDLDNEKSNTDNEELTEEEEVPLTKKKSVRSEKQMIAFKKAQETRQANIKRIQHEKELLKLNKKEEKLNIKKKELEITDHKAKEFKESSKPVLHNSPESSSEEEEITVIKKRKSLKRKQLLLKKQIVKVKVMKHQNLLKIGK